MKVTKEFAPITIVLDSVDDVRTLTEILRTAYKADRRYLWSHLSSTTLTDLQERVLSFAKLLGVQL